MTGPQTWAAVDAWASGLLPEDPDARAAQAAADAAGLPAIQVSVQQGRLLAALAASVGARRAVEVGTLAGVSTIWLAKALRGPDARMVTFELVPEHAAVARANVARAGLADVVDVRVGPAVDGLAALAAEGPEPFDLAFVDADKPSNVAYVRALLPLLRPGALLVVDNVVRAGAVIDPDGDGSARGSRAVVEEVARTVGLTAAVLQTVGEKGYDGFALLRVR